MTEQFNNGDRVRVIGGPQRVGSEGVILRWRSWVVRVRLDSGEERNFETHYLRKI